MSCATSTGRSTSTTTCSDCPFANEPTPWFDGPELEKGVGVPGARLRQVSLWVGENSTMELIEYANRPATSTAPVPNNFIGCRPRLLQGGRRPVDQEESWKVKGVTFYSDVNVVDSGPLAGWRWVYFSDPDGLALELVEIAYYRKDEREANAAHYVRTRPSLSDIERSLV